MTGPSHVLSPEGEWLHFDAWDPAGVEAVKDLLTCGNTRDRVPPTTESGGRAALTADPLARTYVGGTDSGSR